MSWTEQEYADFMARRAQGAAKVCAKVESPSKEGKVDAGRVKAKRGKGAEAPGKFQGENLTLILPFKLPTWNALLAMNQWQRAKVRHWLHDAILLLSPTEGDSQILTVSASRLCSMGLSIEDYYRMIAPKSSRKSGVNKCRVRKKRR